MANIIEYGNNPVERLRREMKKEARYFKDKTTPQAEKKAHIQIVPGQVAHHAKELGKALYDEVFQRDGMLVSIETLKSKRPYERYELTEGSIVINPLELDEIQALGNLYCSWMRYNESTRKYTSCDCPVSVARQLMSVKKEWLFRKLAGIIHCPTIRNDGSLLVQPGYDDASGLYAYFNPDDYPDILQEPGKEEALAALAYLKEAISEFPFKTDLDQSVALAAMFTSIIRPFVKTAPMFAITAPCPGTGKSALADLVSIIATGKAAAAFQYFPDETELAKSLFAVLLSGPAVISFDNVTDLVRSRTLNSVLTQETMEQRILGQSKTMAVPTSPLIMMNGNNLTIAEDMTRRVLYCCLDANVEKPAARKFRRDLYSFARQERSNLITAILTILKAYHLNGCPGANDLKPMGSYEAWSEKIRGALVWLEEPDPLDTQATLESLDPVRSNTEAVFLAWHELFGNEKKTTQSIMETIECDSQQNEKAKNLKNALSTAIVNPKGVTSKTLGTWLSKNKDTICGNFKLIRYGLYNGYVLWYIDQLT